jgi:uncharacterized OsmC-like protein
MPKEVVTTSAAGYSSETTVRDFEVTIDPNGETAPDTVETLLADYAACFVPALRVGAEQRDAGDLGRIENHVTGEVDDDGKLTAVRFDIRVGADIDDETAGRVVERAFELCKVHDALGEHLHAETSVEGSAF